MAEQTSRPSLQVQVLQPSPAGPEVPLARRLPPGIGQDAGGVIQPRSVQATEPSSQLQVLQPSLAGKLLPSLRIWPPYTQAEPPPPQSISVHCQSPSTQLQVLHPSPAGALTPSA